MLRPKLVTMLLLLVFMSAGMAMAQSATDTIRLGAITIGDRVYPMVLLPEQEVKGKYLTAEERIKHDFLRNNVYAVYPYALTAATVFKSISDTLEKLDGRRVRKEFLKETDRQLDRLFKQPLKSMSMDQGHVLVKLIDRQTGRNCYSIIKELKGGLSAVVWQGVGLVFNNNLAKDYDPEGKDAEIERIVRELEASNAYRYQLYQQQALLNKIADAKK